MSRNHLTIRASENPSFSASLDRDTLILSYIPLMKTQAWSLAHENIDRFEDLVSFGYVALVETVDAMMEQLAHDTRARRYCNIGKFIQTGLFHRMDNYLHSSSVVGNDGLVSLDMPLYESGEEIVGDAIADRSPIETDDRAYVPLYEALERQREAHRMAIGYRYALPGYGQVVSLRNEALHLGIVPETMSTWARQGLLRLRKDGQLRAAYGYAEVQA
jgi:hypothetical protein